VKGSESIEMKKKDKKNKKLNESSTSVRDIREQALELMKSSDVAELDQVEIPEEVRDRLSIAGNDGLEELERELGMDEIEADETERVKAGREEYSSQVEEEVEEEPELPSVDGSCLVRVSEDAMSALISLHPSQHGGNPLTVEYVRKEIASAGVVYGVNEDLLKKLVMTVEKTKEDKQEVIFARGTPPEEGKDGRVQFYFDEDERVLSPPEEEGGRH
jgi:uncharacterized protein (DUF342 family)